jgi:hypothetical protein
MPDTPGSQVPPASSSQPPVPPTTPSFQPVAAPPPASYQPVTAPPPKQGSSALKIVLIVVGIFVGLGLIGVGVISYGVYKLSHAVHMSDSTPVTESDLGVAIYPGAKQAKGTMRMTLVGKSMITANFLTPDSKDQVMAFYQSNLGPAARSTTNAYGGSLFLTKSSSETVGVTITQNPALNDAETQIVIVHAANASGASQ